MFLATRSFLTISKSLARIVPFRLLGGAHLSLPSPQQAAQVPRGEAEHTGVCDFYALLGLCFAALPLPRLVLRESFFFKSNAFITQCNLLQNLKEKKNPPENSTTFLARIPEPSASYRHCFCLYMLSCQGFASCFFLPWFNHRT